MNQQNNVYTQAKLKFLCRRGMSELEDMLYPFFNQQFSTLSVEEQNQFAELLDKEDVDLWEWLIQRKSAPSSLKNIIDLIITHAQA